MSALWQWAWPLALGAAGTILGWLALEFALKPVRRFFDFKSEVVRQHVIFANVSAKYREADFGRIPSPETFREWEEAQEKRLAEAQTEFRTLGAQMHGFCNSERVAVAIVRCLGYDPEGAAKALIGISNSIDTYGKTRSWQRQQLEKALKITTA